MDEKLINHAVKYVEDNIARSDLSVEELSKELGMSRVHLYKKLLAITGKTPIEFIRIIRLQRAAQLLRGSQQNISEIAYQVGFNNPKYFSRYILRKNLVYYLRLFNIDKADSSQYFIVSFKVCIGVSSTDIRSVTDFIYE